MIVFKVVHINTGEIRTVYAVNGTSFLLHNAESTYWYYEDMNHFVPWGD
jgi:hypothetical protein